MDNRWQMSKCGPTWQSSSEPAVVVAPPAVSQVQSQDSSRTSIINSSHYTYPHIVQEPSSSTRKLITDPLFQTSNYNLYNSEMGTPFFTLLSGPPYDTQQVLSSKPVIPSTNAHVYNSTSTVGPTGHESSQNIDNRYLKSKIVTRPLVPVRSLASDGGNTAACLNAQSNSFSSLRNLTVSGTVPAQHGKLHSSSVHHPLSPPTSVLPRVFCLYASGDLFLTYGGLLGVVCSCHGFHMSISKFSEHSGLNDVNPGDAVHMDSGETIAQWRKVYFSKFGFRIPEDNCGWNWPEGHSNSTHADMSKSNQTKFAVISNSVNPSRPYTSESNAHGAPANKTMKPYVSGLSISKLSGDTDKINNYMDCDTMERTKVSSNIELRLGQPSQQNQTLGKLKVAGFNTRVSRVDHPLELVSSQRRLIYNDKADTYRITEENKEVNCAAQVAAKSGSTERQNQLRSSSLGFGAYSTRTAYQPEKLKADVVTGSVNSMLFSQFNNDKDKMPTQHYVGSQISNNGSPRPVISRHVSPRPSLISSAPSMVYSSIMVMNSSPLMTSSKSKVEGTIVLNSHTPSSNHSLFGVEKDPNASGNNLNGSLWSSIKDPSKSTACELATKPFQSGDTSWTANVAEKSTVISVSQETSFQIGKTAVQSNHYQTGPPLPRIGITEDICSSSGHGSAYIPENCSFLVQKNQMVENSNLDRKKFLSAFGEPSKNKAPVLSNSNLQKGCILHDGSISLGKTEEPIIKPIVKKVDINAFQWKDVPNKMAGKCIGSCRDESAKILEHVVDVIDQSTDIDVKSVDQPVQKVDCMKEQVMSNISSKCSAPALTQASVKISNGDSCTDDAQNGDCAKNWSSDDCSNNGSDRFSCKIDSKNETQSKSKSKSVPDRSTRSLVDELRVIDSLRLKKVQNQSPMRENCTSKKTFEKEFDFKKRKRETEFKILGKSFHTSPLSSISTGNSSQSFQSLKDEHKLDKDQKSDYDDFLEISEYSRGKKVRTDLEFKKIKSVCKQELPCRRFTKPVVCGRYGLISNGDTSKPAKILSLKRIIKTSRRCSPVGDEFVQKSVVKPLKKNSTIREQNQQTDRFFSLSEEKCHIEKGTEVFIDDGDTTETSDSDFDFGTKKRRKVKKIRKRSLHELIAEEKGSGFATTPKNIASIPQDNFKNGGNINNLHEVENIFRSPKQLTCKSTSDVDKFCNVCGSFNNDELNCLLECNLCLIKVHQACYGVSKVPKNDWYCRPCRENATNMACVLCGYEGGVMTRALHSGNIVRSLLNAWNIVTESQETKVNFDAPNNILCDPMVKKLSYPVNDKVVKNSITAGFFDPTVKQWVHMVCG